MKKHNLKPITAAVNAGLLLMLSACSGGSDDEKPLVQPKPPAPPEPTSFNVTVIDGYIRGAIAYIDLNGNKERDEGEPFTETVEGGEGVIDTTGLGLVPENVSVIVDIPEGAVDESTITDENPDGVPIADGEGFQLVSLPGENVATPITTLISMVAGEEGDVEEAKAEVAEQLGISTDEASSDYIADENEELTVLTEVMIENEVIPKNVTTDVDAADVVVAAQVASTIAGVIDQASEAGTLTEQKDVISEAAGAVTDAVNAVTEGQSEQLADIDEGTLGDIIEQVADVTSDIYQDLVVSETDVTEEELAQAQVQAEIVSNAVSGAIVEQGVSEEGLTEEAVEEIQASAEVISDVVESLVEEQDESEEGLTEEAIEDIQEVTDIIADVVEELVEQQASGEDGLTAEEIANVATAIEVVTQIVEQIIENNDGVEGGLSVEDVTDIAEIVAEEVIEEVEELVESGLTEEEIQEQVEDTANETATDLEEALENDVELDDFDGDGIANDDDDDIDGDGVENDLDDLPYNASESVDTDNDGIGNNEDTDDDNDGVEDAEDAFPLDSAETLDTDSDGTGDNADTDDDNDGVEDAEDAFPLDEAESADTDGDGTGNNADTDDDNDGVSDEEDDFPLDEAESTDTDGDGTGDNADTDDDNDGVSDEDDLESLNPDVSFGGLADEINKGTMYLLWDEYNEEYGYGDIDYETLTVDSATNEISLVSYELSDDDGIVEFVAKSENDDDEYELILTADGWQENLNDYSVQSQTKDGTTTFINGAGSIAITNGEAIDTANLTMSAALEALGLYAWATNVDQAATFDESANLYQTTFTAGSDDYMVDLEVDCVKCGAISPDGEESLTRLDDLFVDFTRYNDNDGTVGLSDIWLAHSENSDQSLHAEFLSSSENTGSINLFVYDDNGPRLLSAQAQWRIEEVMGQEIVRVTLPENVETLAGFEIDLDEANSRFFALVRGYVRMGQLESEGSQDDSEAWINEAAYEQIIENFGFGDFDNDGQLDIWDNDDDNDGVLDSEDAFPRNALLKSDLDNDGIADSLDNDIDGDGVGNDTDIAPENAEFSQALSLSADDLASAYISPNETGLDGGVISLWSGTQSHWLFDGNGVGTYSSYNGSLNMEWQLDDNVLSVNYAEDNESIVNYYSFDQLVDLGLISMQDAKNYCYELDCSFEISTKLVSSTLHLVENDEGSVTFWRKDVDQYFIPDTSYAYTQYPGLADLIATNSYVDSEYEVSYIDLDTAETNAFDATSVEGQWVLPVAFEDNRLRADLISFNSDGTATSQVHDLALTWVIDSDGSLALSGNLGDESISLTYTQLAQYDDGVAIYAEVTYGEKSLYGHHMGMKASSEAIEFTQEEQFLLSGVTLGNAYSATGSIEFPLEDLFGFYFYDDGSVNRLFGSSILDGYDPEVWSWQQNDANTIVMSRYRSIENNNYQDSCISDMTEDCYIWRTRNWHPVKQVGDRLYVLEWSQYDGNFDPANPDWVSLIPARLNFYETYQSDLVDDVVSGNSSADRDSDGIANVDDAFPDDNYEWLDSDGDGIGNNADWDDDNDGVADWDDAFPEDATESSDADMDGIGDIADIDDDNDGIDDSVDLDPLDPNISEGLLIDVSELAPKYIRLSEGYLAEPSISTSQITGEIYTFDFANDQVGKVDTPSGSMDFVYEDAGAHDRLNYTSNNSEVREMNVYDLLEFGYISDEAANQYSAAYNSQVEVTVQKIRAEIVWLENGDTQDRFWWTDVETWQIKEDTQREILFGSVDAQAIERNEISYEVILTEYDSLTPVDYTADEVVGSWGLPITFDSDPDQNYQRIVGEYATFNADNTGSTMITNAEFTWEVVNGKLAVTYTNGVVIELERIESTESGDVVVASTSFDGIDYNVVRLSTKADSAAGYNNFIGDYLMNSFTLTNPDAYDENGEVIYENYYGFRLNDDNTVNRIYDGNFDFSTGFGNDQWIWTELSANEVQLTALVEKDMDGNWVSETYADCDLAESNCYEWRKRNWKILKETEDRIYVLEWAFWDQNIWDETAQEQNFELVIPPRVQFYQKYTLDTDKDGMRDDVDMDDDNDGFADTVDDFPFDSDEWLDTDGDGIGNNEDLDDDGDGVLDEDDDFPLDESETTDTDGDGIGDNSDLAPADNLVGTVLPFNESNLSSRYLGYSKGYLANPNILLGDLSGDVYTFSEDAVVVTTPEGALQYSYSFNEDVLTLDSSDNEGSKEFLSLVELGYKGVLSFDDIDQFQQAYGHSKIHFIVNIEKVELSLLVDGETTDSFLLTEMKSYQVFDDNYRVALLGSVDVAPILFEEESRIVELLDLSSVNLIEYTEAEVVGSWGFPSAIDSEEVVKRSDYLTFNADFTGVAEFEEQSFTWSIDENGSLALAYNTGDTLSFQRIESVDGIDLVIMMANINNKEHSAVDLSIKESISADYQSFVDHFLMKGSVLTSPDFYDESGNLKPESYFGFKLNSDYSAIRFQNNPYSDTELDTNDWRWSELESNEIVLSVFTAVDENGGMLSGLYSNCDPSVELCAEWRRRHWKILAENDESIFVLEWEFWGPPVEEVAEGEEYNLIMKPQIQFYQKFEIEE